MKKAFLGLFLAALALVPVATACGGGVVAAEPGDRGGVSVDLPTEILGLRVQPERVDLSQIQKVSRPYIDQIAVFSMRQGKLLRATLQVARFNRAARPRDPKFRGSISGVLGGQQPIEAYINGTLVDSAAATSQNIFSWFNGRALFVLSVQQDYQFPRTLLRHIIDLDLKL